MTFFQKRKMAFVLTILLRHQYQMNNWALSDIGGVTTIRHAMPLVRLMWQFSWSKAVQVQILDVPSTSAATQ